MINTKGFKAIICCDVCEKELCQGPYPADAEDNLPTDCMRITHDGEKNNEHYCADCKEAKEKEAVEEMDTVLGVCRAFLEKEDVHSAVQHFQSKMKCSEKEAADTVGADSIFYKSINELNTNF